MQNIQISDVVRLLGKEGAGEFLYGALLEDIERTEGRYIEGHQADDCFFTIHELLSFLSRTEFKNFTMDEAVSMLNNTQKAQLFDLVVKGDSEALEHMLQSMCRDNVLFEYKFKIELLNRLRKAEDLKDTVYKYMSGRC